MKEEIRPLIQYTIQKHWDNVFSKVLYVRTFSQMKVRCQQFADTTGNEGTFGPQQGGSMQGIISPGTSPMNLQWRKEREHDDEELFFSKDDEEMVGMGDILELNSFFAISASSTTSKIRH